MPFIPHWATPIPRPPDDNVPCAGFSQFFDLDVTDAEEGDSESHFYEQRRELRIQARPALELCASCPLVNRLWCLNIIRPTRNVEFTGVAGGNLYLKSRKIGDIDDIFEVNGPAQNRPFAA